MPLLRGWGRRVSPTLPLSPPSFVSLGKLSDFVRSQCRLLPSLSHPTGAPHRAQGPLSPSLPLRKGGGKGEEGGERPRPTHGSPRPGWVGGAESETFRVYLADPAGHGGISTQILIPSRDLPTSQKLNKIIIIIILIIIIIFILILIICVWGCRVCVWRVGVGVAACVCVFGVCVCVSAGVRVWACVRVCVCVCAGVWCAGVEIKIIIIFIQIIIMIIIFRIQI